MNTRLITRTLLVTIALVSGGITLCVNDFILINRSGYDIFCRDRSVAQAQDNTWTSPDNSNVVLKPGEQVKLSARKSYSIRTAGKKSVLSNYYDVPKPLDLAQKTLSRNDAIAFEANMWDKGFLPIISVSAGLVYGWKFTLGSTWTSKADQQKNNPGGVWTVLHKDQE